MKSVEVSRPFGLKVSEPGAVCCIGECVNPRCCVQIAPPEHAVPNGAASHFQLLSPAGMERDAGELSVERLRERHGNGNLCERRWCDAPRLRRREARGRGSTPPNKNPMPAPLRLKPKRSRSTVVLRLGVDRDVLEKAQQVCAALDLNLAEVLRELMRRVAVERALDLGTCDIGDRGCRCIGASLRRERAACLRRVELARARQST